MGKRWWISARAVVSWSGAAGLVLLCACGTQMGGEPQGPAAQESPAAKEQAAPQVAAALRDPNTLDPALFPRRGKPRLASEPAEGVFGQIYVHSKTGREWIYDGSAWVPHDDTVDEFYRKRAERRAALTQEEVTPPGQTPTATGAHAKHEFDGVYRDTKGQVIANGCRICHLAGGVLAFKPEGPAVVVGGQPLPTFDAVAKTCSSVACHSVKRGTFSYYFPGGDGDPVLNTVNYGGGAPRLTPSWYATGAVGCTACHDDPPRNGSDGSNVWHSGYHGGQGPAGARNQCQFCHPDASSPGTGAGDTITNPVLHVNGAVNVQATFTSACFGCH